MQLIKSEEFLGNSKVMVGDLQSDMVLQTLGKIYIRSGKSLKLLTDLTETIANSDSNVIMVESTKELDSLEYPGDGKFIYNSGNSILYLSYKDRYLALIEVTSKTGNYVKKTGDTMTGTLEMATTKVPFIVHSSKLVKNLNAEYLNGETAETFAHKNKDEGITGSWKFLSDCVSEAKWKFLNNVSIKADVITSGSFQSPIFINGYTGTGWRLDGSTNTLTIDNLVVRKVMQVYELVINKISATNGSVWVSNSSKIDSVYTTDGSDRYYISGNYLVYITNTETFSSLKETHTADELAQDVITNGEESEYYNLLYTYNIESELNKEINQVVIKDNQPTTENLYKTYFEGGLLYVIYTNKDEYSTLKTGDIVRCQKFQDNTIKYYDALIYSQIDINRYVIQVSTNIWDKYSSIEYDENGNIIGVTYNENDNLYKKTRFDYQFDPKNTDYYVSKLAEPSEGDDLVQIGNIQDPTRQGAIYLTATDDQGPYIEVLDGVNRPDYSVLKEVPVFITYLYKNIQYYVSTTQKINNIEGVSLGKFIIANDNTITKSDPETNSGTDLYGYKYPYDTSFLIKKEVSETYSKYLSKYSNPVKVRLGNLEGIYNYLLGNKQPHGYGLYGENVYLTGEFYLNNGKSVVDFSEEQVMLKYGKAGMTIKDGKISFEAGILDINMDSAGNESRVRFNNGTMVFYHKITQGEYDKIKNESEESGTDISNIIQDDKGIWVRSIYLGYGIPNSDDSGEYVETEAEPLLIFCDYKGQDLYNLGPSGMFKTQIQSPMVHKGTIKGLKLNGIYDPTPNSSGVSTINGTFKDINYFYITAGNNNVQKRFGIAIQYQDGKTVTKTIESIAKVIYFSYIGSISADQDPPKLQFGPDLSAETLPSFVNYTEQRWYIDSIWHTFSYSDDKWEDGSGMWDYNPYEISITGTSDSSNNIIKVGTYTKDTRYTHFWNLIDGNYTIQVNDNSSQLIQEAVGFLQTAFTQTNHSLGNLGLFDKYGISQDINDNTAFIHITYKTGITKGIAFSPIYGALTAASEKAENTEINIIAYELAFSILERLLRDGLNTGTYTLSTVSFTSTFKKGSISTTNNKTIESPNFVIDSSDAVDVYNVSYNLPQKKLLLDSKETEEGTITSKTDNNSNMVDINITINSDGSLVFSTQKYTGGKYLFYYDNDYNT